MKSSVNGVENIAQRELDGGLRGIKLERCLLICPELICSDPICPNLGRRWDDEAAAELESPIQFRAGKCSCKPCGQLRS